MLNITTGRFVWTFIVGALVASNLNWAVAELLLNDWAMPRFDGFMRTMETGGAAGSNIARMAIGFIMPLFVIAWFQASLTKPENWVTRAIVVSLLVSFGAFYGTYTFISGWGNVNWMPLMVTANCDAACMVVGALIIGFLQEGGMK